MTVITETAVDDSIGVTCFRVREQLETKSDQHADRKHKAKMVTPTYTVMLLQ